MIENVSKPKLRKGLSYVLKTSQLEQALLNAEINIHTSLDYSQCGGSILKAFYWLPNPNIEYPRLYICAGVVDSPLRTPASLTLLEEGLPAFINWVRYVIALPDNSPVLFQKPYFNATYTDNCLNIWALPNYWGIHNS